MTWALGSLLSKSTWAFFSLGSIGYLLLYLCIYCCSLYLCKCYPKRAMLTDELWLCLIITGTLGAQYMENLDVGQVFPLLQSFVILIGWLISDKKTGWCFKISCDNKCTGLIMSLMGAAKQLNGVQCENKVALAWQQWRSKAIANELNIQQTWLVCMYLATVIHLQLHLSNCFICMIQSSACVTVA